MKTTLKQIGLLLLMILMLSHCALRKVDVKDEVRDPAEQTDSVIQITPMAPEAVQLLISEADEHLQQGLYQDALLTLKRALNISPQSALVQQNLAEVYLGSVSSANDRIAQAVIARAPQAQFCEVDALDPTDRGAGGFGSTGRA